jgi:proteasome lid subunit RPN8/RPN11
METMEAISTVPGLIEAIKRHCTEQNDRWGSEAVGFMARKPGSQAISTVVRLNNHSSNPTDTFFVEPWEQFRAEETLRAAGYEIVGVYHSHPTGEARPSRTDEMMARPGELTVIYSVCFDDLTAWREDGGRLVQVDIS